ncbi:hypothetical protein BKA81DRAFT_345109 [Phyllosticta paracitricarpa]
MPPYNHLPIVWSLHLSRLFSLLTTECRRPNFALASCNCHGVIDRSYRCHCAARWPSRLRRDCLH